MKKHNLPHNPYATNSINPIQAPHKAEKEPASTVKKGNDLRIRPNSK
ncbi:MAG: hypothetical protein J6K61_04885 [Clostridia bacterium]|nr:hypothetical protein [Clostridia bacterium]